MPIACDMTEVEYFDVLIEEKSASAASWTCRDDNAQAVAKLLPYMESHDHADAARTWLPRIFRGSRLDLRSGYVMRGPWNVRHNYLLFSRGALLSFRRLARAHFRAASSVAQPYEPPIQEHLQ